MSMKDYRTIVVGTDGSSLAEPTVGWAAWLAKHDDANLVIVRLRPAVVAMRPRTSPLWAATGSGRCSDAALPAWR
ncbi:MAG: universal stress protein [Micropruina sp.]